MFSTSELLLDRNDCKICRQILGIVMAPLLILPWLAILVSI
jgi:hypothetical protein